MVLDPKRIRLHVLRRLAVLVLGLVLPASGASPAPMLSGYAATNPRGVAIFSAPPGAPLLILGQNLGTSGTVAFNGVPAPPAASWSATEILVTVPTAPSYPFQGPVTVTTDGQSASGPAFTITPPPPLPPIIRRLSPPPLDLEVPLRSDAPAISADGRFVAFGSDGQLFVQDRQMGKTERVSNGFAPEWSSPEISADGRFVAFASEADYLVPGDTNDNGDIFVRDRRTGTTELVSVAAGGAPANGWSDYPAISSDGRFVAFLSGATNLVPGITNDWTNVLVRDRQSGKTERVGITYFGGDAYLISRDVRPPAISADGRFVAFRSWPDNLVPEDTDGPYDIVVRDRQTGKTELVSVGVGGAPANATSLYPAISADGRFVAFSSGADNLVPGIAGGGIFVRDRQSGKTEWIGNGFSPAISADGRFVAFQEGSEIFVRDRQTGKTERIAAGDYPSISADGRFVAFQGGGGILVRDRVAATSEVIAASVNVSRSPLDSGAPAISADGQWVVFVTAGQVFERNRITGAAALVSATPSGAPANGGSGSRAISADGRFIAFMSGADNLVPGDTNGQADIFVRDRQSGKTELVSVTPSSAPANGNSADPAISADGRFVAFWSYADNLVPGDTNGWSDVFVRDRQTGKTERIAAGDSPAISADGRFVAFGSWADNLVPGDTNGQADIFVRDRLTGKTDLVSVGVSGAPADDSSAAPAISADGRFVAFWSWADNLVPGIARGIFVRDRQSGMTERVGDGGLPAISADGRFVAFWSFASIRWPGDTNGWRDVFVRDRRTGQTERIAAGGSPSISADGRFVAFQSAADNLVPGDTNFSMDVFVAERR